MTALAAKKKSSHLNPIESLGDVSQSVGPNTVDSLSNLGGSMLDQLLGVTNNESQSDGQEEFSAQENSQKKEAKKAIKKEANLFTFYF